VLQIHRFASARELSVPHPSTPRTRRVDLTPISRPDPLPQASEKETLIRAQLERICGSRIFTEAHRSQLFLRYVVEHSLAHPDDPIKEYSIALDVFDREASYDPAVNNTVRVEAGRLRSRLLEYYAGEGQSDPFLIEIPRGRYRPVIHSRQPSADTAPHLPLISTKRPATSPRERRMWVLPAAFHLGALLARRAAD
jgi:hypothetical protein